MSDTQSNDSIELQITSQSDTPLVFADIMQRISAAGGYLPCTTLISKEDVTTEMYQPAHLELTADDDFLVSTAPSVAKTYTFANLTFSDTVV